MKVRNAGLQMEGLCFAELSLYTIYRDLLAVLDHGMHVDVHVSLDCLVLATTTRNSR